MPRIANRPIVCHALEALKAAGTGELALAVPPDALEEVRRSVMEDPALGLEITYLTTGRARELRSALAAIEPFVGDDACLIHTASGVGQPLPPLNEMLPDESPDLSVFVHRSPHGQPLGVAAQGLLEVGARDTGPPLAPAGVWSLGPGALRLVRSSRRVEYSDLDLIALAKRIADAGGHFQMRELRPWRSYTGDPLDLLAMNRIVLDQLGFEDPMVDGPDNQIDGRLAIDPSAEVSSSVILGPVVIGAGARIEDAYIGPYTSIGNDVQIQGAEIERSIVLDGASIRHVADRISMSTVGRGARIFGEFGVPRAIRLHVGSDVQVALTC